MFLSERTFRRVLVAIALVGLTLGLVAWIEDRREFAQLCWVAGTVPVIVGLSISIARDMLAGRMGVDSVALVSMASAVVLDQALASIVIAIMYAGGNVLEDIALAHAERDLRLLIERAPRTARRQVGSSIQEIPIDEVIVGDVILVRAGEVIPVDGIIVDHGATIDDSALSGEPIPVFRQAGERVRSGSINAGELFLIRASSTAGESTYAGILRMVNAAQMAKSPFIRMADRYALLLLPTSLFGAGVAWLFSGDPVRGLAVLVAATPCPLILAAPVAFISGIAQAAKRGILIKGSGPLEALAQAHTVMFDKTGTLTVGGARLVAIEVAPGQENDEVLQLAASLEQASHHVVAVAIVDAAVTRNLKLGAPSQVRETLGAGLEGVIDGKAVRVGSHHLVNGAGKPEAWVVRALRRAAWRSALSVFVAVDGRTIGALLLADEIRRETPRAVQAVRTAGVSRIVMVTGDRTDSAETIGAALDLDAVLADREPADKVDAVATEKRQNVTVMVGDGINDAPALAAANVGIALGARGASASSEAADIVILVDSLDRVSDAIRIAKRTRAIALQSIVSGMALSGLAMGFAAIGWLPPVAGALTQEAIDVSVILNALRALSPGYVSSRRGMPVAAAGSLHADHARLEPMLDRLRQIADALDRTDGDAAVAMILEAVRIVEGEIVTHERGDERQVYPRVAKYLADRHGLRAMSRAHREIIHLSRLLKRLTDGLRPENTDSYVIRDAQKVIESVEALVRIHNAQEEDIYEYATGG
jgi:heavy metal translocating P-type ATPase